MGRERVGDLIDRFDRLNINLWFVLIFLRGECERAISLFNNNKKLSNKPLKSQKAREIERKIGGNRIKEQYSHEALGFEERNINLIYLIWGLCTKCIEMAPFTMNPILPAEMESSGERERERTLIILSNCVYALESHCGTRLTFSPSLTCNEWRTDMSPIGHWCLTCSRHRVQRPGERERENVWQHTCLVPWRLYWCRVNRIGHSAWLVPVWDRLCCSSNSQIYILNASLKREQEESNRSGLKNDLLGLNEIE